MPPSYFAGNVCGAGGGFGTEAPEGDVVVSLVVRGLWAIAVTLTSARSRPIPKILYTFICFLPLLNSGNRINDATTEGLGIIVNRTIFTDAARQPCVARRAHFSAHRAAAALQARTRVLIVR